MRAECAGTAQDRRRAARRKGDAMTIQDLRAAPHEHAAVAHDSELAGRADAARGRARGIRRWQTPVVVAAAAHVVAVIGAVVLGVHRLNRTAPIVEVPEPTGPSSAAWKPTHPQYWPGPASSALCPGDGTRSSCGSWVAPMGPRSSASCGASRCRENPRMWIARRSRGAPARAPWSRAPDNRTRTCAAGPAARHIRHVGQ